MDLVDFDRWSKLSICIFKWVVLEADLTDMVLAVKDGLLGLWQEQQLVDVEVGKAIWPKGVGAERPLFDRRPRHYI